MAREMVMVVANDWAHYNDQVSAESMFGLMVGRVFGLLIAENETAVVIAHHEFPEEKQLRHVTTIPKSNVLSIVRYPILDKLNDKKE